MSLLLKSCSLVISLVNMQLLSDVAETVTAFVTRDCHDDDDDDDDDDDADADDDADDDETNSVSDTLDHRIVFNITALLLRTNAKTASNITPHCLILIFPTLLKIRGSYR
jgi:ABC-type Zn2+ transport system substrate-binding protein/surface adhesin